MWHIDELMKAILEFAPNALFHEDQLGEIVISTGFTMISSEGHIAPIQKEQ